MRSRPPARTTGRRPCTRAPCHAAGVSPMNPPPPEPLPFPDSLCHRCAAPPKYVRSKTSTFILCPLLPQKYPPQPVRACALFRPKPTGPR